MTLREFAQAYQERQGWSVIPCLPNSKKAAIGWKAYQERLPDEQELNDFFAGYDDRNLAIITGEVSNRLLVVDFDDFSLWVEWWTKLYRRSTLSVLTGKGIHLYFRLLDEPVTCGKFTVFGKPAGDIRYNGGYVLAPPSIHPNGQKYRWIDAPLLNVKFEELKLERPKQSVTSVQQRPGRPVKPPQPIGDIKNPKAYAESALSQEVEKVETAQEGTRNMQLHTSAVKLAKYADILGTDWIRTRLIAAAHSVGLGTMEASKTVNSGLNKALVRSI